MPEMEIAGHKISYRNVADLHPLAEVKAAQPAKGYMGRYGNPGGPWTTDRFIEAVYRRLAKEKS